VFKLLVSDRVAFGMPEVLDAVVLLVRLGLCWLCVRSLEISWDLWGKDGQVSSVEFYRAFISWMSLHLLSGMGALL